MSDTLTALDATFLELEEADEGALMSIGGVMVFDPRPDGGMPTVEEVCCALAPRLDRLPRYSQRLSCTRTPRWAWPRWVPDERFDIHNHVTRGALPAPGGPGELCDWAAGFYSHRLDRTRPLWEVVVLEGLEGGRWALAHKAHHCLVDGVGAVGVAQVLLDEKPRPRRRTAATPVPPSADVAHLTEASVPGSAQPIVQATRTGARLAVAGLEAARHPRETLARAGALAELLVRDELIAAPHSSINVAIGSTRRYAVIHASLDDLKAIRAALGGSVNDVVLAACTTGLRKLLLERGEQPPTRGLRAMVPVNLRLASERLALGNRISSLFVELPVAEPAAQLRYEKIAATTARLKMSGAGLGANTVIELAATAPPVVHALLARSLYATRLFNVTITNVPGPQHPLYALGAPLREVHPIVPLAAEHSVGIAAFSYNGRLTLGLIADHESTPDLAVLAYGVSEGLEELATLAGSHSQHTPIAKART